MAAQLLLGDIRIDVVFKDIKNIHLSVLPPAGKVRISAPLRMNRETVRIFAISKLGWIRKQQKKLKEQERETLREYRDRESHYIWGKRYLLQVLESDQAPSIELRHNRMILTIRPETTQEKRQAIIEEWYRNLIKQAYVPLIRKWEPIIGVKVEHCFIQRMKTKWGSCNHEACNIRLNTHLAKKPSQCLEYVLVHEVIHLLEPKHNDRFISMMDKYMPRWQQYKNELNSAPLSFEHWKY
ncbi:MAG: SprT family zinc-dependent metalloprotease [Dehalococcoidia bacterium]